MATTTPTMEPFLDWYGIWPGQSGRDEDGYSFFEDPPVGVRLRVQEARKSAVFFGREQPWEQHTLNKLTILRDGDRYRMWYAGRASDDRDEHFSCYAESEDGYHWVRPDLGLFEFSGSTANNIICREDDFGFQSVFIDPQAPADAHYKAVDASPRLFRNGIQIPASQQNRTEIREIRDTMLLDGHSPAEIDAAAEVRLSLRGAISADGLHWTVLDEPLFDAGKTMLDTQNIAAFDTDTGEYVAYLRGHVERQRCVRRTGGPKFGGWGEARMVLMADADDPPSQDVYNSCYCRAPGSGRRLMFPKMFHRLPATLDVQFASSRDGWNWIRPERRPIITRDAEDGTYASISASPELVPLGDDWALGCLGVHHLHDWGGYPQHDPDGEYLWALWKPNRLVALEACDEGRFTTVERVCSGKGLFINYRTEPGGWIRVALVEKPQTPPQPMPELPGHSADECDVLSGDELCRQVTWKGSGDLSELKDREVSVRFQLAKAQLFAMGI